MSSGYIRITHPHHPLCGQQVEVIRLRRGEDPDLIIRHPDGFHTAIAMSCTDYAGASAAQDHPQRHLLDIAGLCQVAQFIAEWQQSASGWTEEVGYD
ncbi:Y4bD/Y4pK family protein [Chloroflexi bacterium TSY]|nr:Y4bD/Y4pK family protein [Chloroflexi bacterium TSY]